jgi:hypothetical protein
MVPMKALMSISLPRPLRTKIQPIRMRAISTNVSEVLATSLSVYDSVGCDDAVTDRTLMVTFSFRFPVWRERIEAARPAILFRRSAAAPIAAVKLSRTDRLNAQGGPMHLL